MRYYKTARILLHLVAGALLVGSGNVCAGPVWQLNTKGLSNAVERALVGKRGSELVAAKLVKDQDRAIKDGLNKLIAAAGVTADAAKRRGIPPGIVNGIGRLVDVHGEAAAKQFLRDVDQLYDWARAADASAGGTVNMQMLGEMARKFSVKDYSNWKGAWFELQLASSYAKSNQLRRLQPPAPPFNLSFRDGGIQYDLNTQAYIEAKNWTLQARGSAATVDAAAGKLAGQLDSHFERLRRYPHLVGFPPGPGGVPNVPPGLKLVYDFSEVMPPKWRQALKDKAVAALQEHFGVDEQTAKNWADNHLHFRVCSPTPFSCAEQ